MELRSMKSTMSKDSSTTETVRQFPTGLRVLLVDDDPSCLTILSRKLQELCKYEVTPCTRATDALSLLLEKSDGFDIVLTDFRMPDMDGLQLLELIRSMEIMDQLPVVLFSGELDEDVVTRGVKKGACDFLSKPIRDEALKMIWQHVLRLKFRKEGAIDCSISEVNQQDRLESAIQSSTDNATAHQNAGCSKRKRDDLACVDQGNEVKDNKGIETDTAAPAAKKPRVKWTSDLHQKFLKAIDIVDGRKNPDKGFRDDGSGQVLAVPREILEEMQKMGVKGLTRQIISSHLQKHRTSIKRQGESLEQQNTPADPSCTTSRPYNSLLVELDSPAQAVPYPAAHHHILAGNFPADYAVQQPTNFLGINHRQVGPLPVALMTQQVMFQHNQPIQSPIWNPSPGYANAVTAPANLRFGPCSVNQSTSSNPIEHYQFVENCLQKTAELPADISAAAHASGQSFSDNYSTQLHAPQQATAGFDTRAVINDNESLSKQDFAASTILNEDIGQLDLDLSFLNNWIDIEGGQDTRSTLQGLIPPTN